MTTEPERAAEELPCERPKGFFEFVRALEADGDIDPDEASEGIDLSVGDLPGAAPLTTPDADTGY